MIETTLHFCAALLLLFFAFMITVPDAKSALLFRYIPGVLGMGMSFFLIARYMGWPV